MVRMAKMSRSIIKEDCIFKGIMRMVYIIMVCNGERIYIYNIVQYMMSNSHMNGLGCVTIIQPILSTIWKSTHL